MGGFRCLFWGAVWVVVQGGFSGWGLGLGGEAEEAFQGGLDGEVGGCGGGLSGCLEFCDVGFGYGELVFELFGADGL
ncbi:hypothetical protein [Arthrobacter glacialis]|uniref:Uncharacterized protein n=1 Tax=Arthrobacter glacialis TaxID=1664 RepID=A0A2S3ZUD5_ARTGL|nr:hypothetical protein [Arthrobacter glacialis]POH72457.1 hypothetical protein CVS27_15080 [Arthrobacter glacialis]